MPPEKITKKRASTPTDATPAKRPKSAKSATKDDNEDIEFQVIYPPMDTKGKVSTITKLHIELAVLQISPFNAKNQPNGVMDQHYVIVPYDTWNLMKKYNNFVIMGDAYRNKEYVFVNPVEKGPTSYGDERDFWVARVLEVRASNPQHVYALVAWLYWPHQLPQPRAGDDTSDVADNKSGRRTYHGSHELIASNYMDVLNVLSFAGKADVEHWLEEDDEDVQQNLYWRQTYDQKTLKLSPIRTHCICNGHYNPDTIMLGCQYDACKLWLHIPCIIDTILTKTYHRLIRKDSSALADAEDAIEIDANTAAPAPSTNSRTPKTQTAIKTSKRAEGKRKAPKKKGLAKKKVYEGLFSAVLKNEKPLRVEVTDLRPDAEGEKTWIEAVVCPKCGTELDFD
jgi:hypothetical protein